MASCEAILDNCLKIYFSVNNLIDHVTNTRRRRTTTPYKGLIEGGLWVC